MQMPYGTGGPCTACIIHCHAASLDKCNFGWVVHSAFYYILQTHIAHTQTNAIFPKCHIQTAPRALSIFISGIGL